LVVYGLFTMPGVLMDFRLFATPLWSWSPRSGIWPPLVDSSGSSLYQVDLMIK
jgi:hypothetical protein